MMFKCCHYIWSAKVSLVIRKRMTVAYRLHQGCQWCLYSYWKHFQVNNELLRVKKWSFAEESVLKGRMLVQDPPIVANKYLQFCKVLLGRILWVLRLLPQIFLLPGHTGSADQWFLERKTREEEEEEEILAEKEAET